MTIVVAGYENTSTGFLATAVPRSAFLIADSALSAMPATGGKRVLVALKEQKIRALPIHIGVPILTSDDYVSPNYKSAFTSSCGLAYSGSQFTFSQVLSKFSHILGELVYAWNSNDRAYQIVPKFWTESEELRTAGQFVIDIDFKSSDLPKLEATWVAHLLELCVTVTLDDVYRLNVEQEIGKVERNHADFALAVYCYKHKRPKLFHVDIVRDKSKAPEWFKAQTTEVGDGDFLVLGTPSWRTDFESARLDAIRDGTSVFAAMKRACDSLVCSNKSANSVGGEIVVGTADRDGFNLGNPSMY